MFSSVTKSPIFKGMSEDNIRSILSLVKNYQAEYSQGQYILHQGDSIYNIGIIIKGSATGFKYGLSGQEVVVSSLTEGSVFADILTGALGFESPVSIKANTDCIILFLNYNELIFCDNILAHKLLQNMIQNISLKYFLQNQRIEILMLKNVRDKITLYLKQQQHFYQSNSFTIPLDRRLMADYLSVERTALSRELSRMKNENLIDYKKNIFYVNF